MYSSGLCTLEAEAEDCRLENRSYLRNKESQARGGWDGWQWAGSSSRDLCPRDGFYIKLIDDSPWCLCSFFFLLYPVQLFSVRYDGLTSSAYHLCLLLLLSDLLFCCFLFLSCLLHLVTHMLWWEGSWARLPV